VIVSYIFGNETLLRVKHIHECTSNMEAGRLDKGCVSQHEVTSVSLIANTVDVAAHGLCCCESLVYSHSLAIAQLVICDVISRCYLTEVSGWLRVHDFVLGFSGL
jgi:hypothetical protein